MAGTLVGDKLVVGNYGGPVAGCSLLAGRKSVGYRTLWAATCSEVRTGNLSDRCIA